MYEPRHPLKPQPQPDAAVESLAYFQPQRTKAPVAAEKDLSPLELMYAYYEADR